MENSIHMFFKAVLLVTTGYVVFALVLFFLQRSLIYYPDNQKPSSESLHARNLQYWPDEDKFLGIISTKAPNNSKGTIIAFHGNAGAAHHRDYFIDALEPLGFRVILAEYPAYGGRDGKLGEKPFLEDAQHLLSAVRKEFPEPIYLLGESMGCGVVSALSSWSEEPIEGVLLITPWDSLAELSQTHYWYLPARWLVRDRYDNISNLQRYAGPVVIGLATEDTIVPPKHTLALYDSLQHPKKLIRFNHSGHNSWPSHGRAKWWKEAMTFISRENIGQQ